MGRGGRADRANSGAASVSRPLLERNMGLRDRKDSTAALGRVVLSDSSGALRLNFCLVFWQPLLTFNPIHECDASTSLRETEGHP